MRKLALNAFIFTVGGLSYGMLEIAWRHYTHWSMVITGGICFLILYHIYSSRPDMNFLLRSIIGSAVITSIELICGCIVNIWLNLGVWDYSRFQMNLWGQICLLYSVLWGLLCIPVSILCVKLKTMLEKHTNVLQYNS